MRFMKLSLIVSFSIALAACGQESEAPKAVYQEVDTLIEDGLIYDGSGGEPYEADIGIRDGIIVFIGDADEDYVDSFDVIAANGLMITPGFIDMHSHAVPEEDYGRAGLPFIYQGITTTSLGLDGDGTSDITDLYARLKEGGIGPNVFSYVGHGYVRRAVMGENDRAPTDEEFNRMKTMVQKGMDEGAFGLSSGLFYVPGYYAETEEVIELARISASYGGIYDTHDRDLGASYKGVGYLPSIREGIEIGEKSNARVIFSHFNAQGALNYGRANEGAALINEARARGLEIAGAQHVYNATQSSLYAYAIPRWASAGGYDAMMARFDDPETVRLLDIETMEMLAIRGGASKIYFIDPAPELNGRTLDVIAENMAMPVPEAVRQILRERKGGVMNLELYDNNNTKYLAQESWMMTCTDGRPPRPDQVAAHPRVYGAFTKKLREYVGEDKIISMAFAIRSMTGLAADFLHLEDRGYIRVGYIADIAVFDRAKIRDVTTYDDPKQYSEGTVHVLVGGSFQIKDGQHTGELTGVSILRK